MALPSLGFRTVRFGGTGFFAVSSPRSSSGALGADASSFFDGESAPVFALFAQPEHVTRAVYFSRSLGGFETNTKVDARGDDADGEAKNAVVSRRAVGAEETSDGAARDFDARDFDFEAFDAFADAAARADSVMDALVRWRDVTSTRAVPREPFRAWFETGEPRASDAGAQQGRGRTQIVEFKSRAPRRVDANDADDDIPPLNVARALVGASSLLLVVAAAVACVQAVLVACDWACRAVFGEEAEEADGVAGSVDEVSLAAPLLDFAYETEERAISRARDEGGDGDGEQLLVLVPLEPEGRRTS